MYNEMFAELDYNKTWNTQTKNIKIEEILGSGSSIPVRKNNPKETELFKLASKRPGNNSFYFVTKDVLDQLTAKGINTESKSGLPLGCMAEQYDVYIIKSNTANAITYTSIIASTKQRGYITTGGFTQTLVLDRSKWTTPLKYNSHPFIPDF